LKSHVVHIARVWADRKLLTRQCRGFTTLQLSAVTSASPLCCRSSHLLSLLGAGQLTDDPWNGKWPWPIGWIILTAVFFYNLTVEGGQSEIIQSSIFVPFKRSSPPGAAHRVFAFLLSWKV
jgi:hypothetical protein